MPASPKVEAAYRNKTIKAVAREASDEQRREIWDRARTIYVGYEAYASRINNRQIHIMILGTGEPQQRALRRALGVHCRGPHVATLRPTVIVSIPARGDGRVR